MTKLETIFVEYPLKALMILLPLLAIVMVPAISLSLIMGSSLVFYYILVPIGGLLTLCGCMLVGYLLIMLLIDGIRFATTW